MAVLPQVIDECLNNGWTGESKKSAFDIELVNNTVLEERFLDTPGPLKSNSGTPSA